MRKTIKLSVISALAFAAGAVQSSSLLYFYDVRPNVLLCLLVVLLFAASDFLEYAVFLVSGFIGLGYSGGLSKETAILGAVLILAFYVKDYLSESEFLSTIALTALTTLLFYLAADFSFILENFGRFLLELAYNVAISSVLWILYPREYEKK